MKPYYLVKLADKQPKLETQADAVTESLRLAKQNPGLSFEILKCVAISQTSEANTFWMDGEELEPEFRYFKDSNVADQFIRLHCKSGRCELATTVYPIWEEGGHNRLCVQIPASELPPEIKP